MTIFTYVDSPLGELLLTGDGQATTGLYMPSHKHRPNPAPDWRRDDEAFAEARQELDEYFAGRRQVFEVPVSAHGTEFQEAVWRELLNVPYGSTISYQGLAQKIGRPGEVRAVGAAVGQNPVCVMVPCHRVVGADGQLTGYVGGLEVKQDLLRLEGAKI